MTNIGVIGSGAMGSGIAQVAATAGHTVFLYDNNPSALERAKSSLGKIMARLVEKGRLTPKASQEIQGRIHYTDSLYQIEAPGLVIEAIVEDLMVKRNVFEQLESIVPHDCILATNTSSLSVAAIAAACKTPERVLGIHFFNPAPLMKLVEIIPAVQTGEHELHKAKALIDSWGKTTVVAKDTPGFIVNRVARPFYGEALRILDEGLADAATIDWAMTTLGKFKMGPFTLMDYIGNDINYTVTETVFQSFYYDPRYKPSFTQKRLSEAGYLGRKTGRGYYDYREGAANPEPQKDKVLGQQILDRIVAILINEAADALYLNIASREDIDMAMTKGVNYPKGLLQWADEMGINRCVERMDRLYHEYLEDRYRCSPMLRKMARNGSTFYPQN
ncbi:3-hydroxyacyl-CoA dehydrogenase NAD-binding domain-containing protein [Phaeodactylibacter luteus]|uniref:3-hydroxybutyryl-CoA dehydrogenase n=1 Tax=Phaeodactylibacter luteus TaxID=1564516 RepID=A0A5C6RMF7_9BACT|nr:3-hydroxyacyl-CoA dehydrogenase NAD-binding domain-containing protein [Phaeodactylibacter luteus]TXB63144.1 3-hydroxybutyryl-CoA dehydrogenase [Phaeodactylibacter luteus]